MEIIISLIVKTITASALAMGLDALYRKVLLNMPGPPLEGFKIPINVGPFSFGITLGKGKPEVSVGVKFVDKAGKQTFPLTFGVTTGKGKKPSWDLGVNLSTEKEFNAATHKFEIDLKHSWKGSEIAKGTPRISASVSVTSAERMKSLVNEAGKKADKVLEEYKRGKITEQDRISRTMKIYDDTILRDWFPRGALKGEITWDLKKHEFGVEFEKDFLKGSLTVPRAGTPSVKLNVLVLSTKDPETGKEKKFALGVQAGEGKPLWKFDSAVDITKDFRISFSQDFNNLLRDSRLTLTKKGKAEQEFIVRQVATQTPTGKKKTTSYLTYKNKDFFPLSINIGDERNQYFLLDMDTIINDLVNKLFPEPGKKGMTWQEKIGYFISKPAQDTLDKLRGKDVPELTAEDLTRAAEQYFKPKTEEAPQWQIDLLNQWNLLHPIGKPKEYQPLFKKLDQREATLLDKFLDGRIGLEDYVRGTSTNIDSLLGALWEEGPQWIPKDFLDSSMSLKAALDAPDYEAVNLIKQLMKNNTEAMEQLGERLQPFDPEGAGYDYATAIYLGIRPDETGHWPSRDPETGLILKGIKHPSWSETLRAEQELGYKIAKAEDGRYYSFLAAEKARPAPERLLQHWADINATWDETKGNFWKQATKDSWYLLYPVFGNFYKWGRGIMEGMEGLGSKAAEAFIPGKPVTKRAKYSDMGEDGLMLAQRLGVPPDTEFEYSWIDTGFSKLLDSLGDPKYRRELLTKTVAGAISIIGAPLALGMRILEQNTELNKAARDWAAEKLAGSPVLSQYAMGGGLDAAISMFANPMAVVKEFVERPGELLTDLSILTAEVGMLGRQLQYMAPSFGKQLVSEAGVPMYTRFGVPIREATGFSESMWQVGQSMQGLGNIWKWTGSKIQQSVNSGKEIARDYLPELMQRVDSKGALNEISFLNQAIKQMHNLDAELLARQATTRLAKIPQEYWDTLRYHHTIGTPYELWPQPIRTAEALNVSNAWHAMEDARRVTAANTGIMTLERMDKRIWKEARELTGATEAQLKMAGYHSDYIPGISEQIYPSSLKKLAEAYKPKFLKEYTKDLAIEKKALPVAISEHHRQFTNYAYKYGLMDDIRQYGELQGIIKRWTPGQELTKGYQIWDPYGAIIKEGEFLKFNDYYFGNLEKLGKVDEAYKVTLNQLYPSQKKILEGMTEWRAERPLFQVPNWHVNQIQAQINPLHVSDIAGVDKAFEWFASATDYWKRAVLSTRPAVWVGDVKDNLIQVLSRVWPDRQAGINWLSKDLESLLSDQMVWRGRAGDMLRAGIRTPDPGVWDKIMDVASLQFFNRKMAGARGAQDTLLHKTLAGYHTERLIKERIFEQYGTNFWYDSQLMKRITTEEIQRLLRNPKLYAEEIAALKKEVMGLVNTTVYDASTILPLLSRQEQKILGTFFPFYEYAIDSFKKATLLGIERPFLAKMLDEFGHIQSQYFTEENERPPQYKTAAALNDQVWFSWLGGGMFSPNWGGLKLLEYNEKTGQFELKLPPNPYVEAVFEQISGKDRRFGDTFSMPGQMLVYDYDTGKMKAIHSDRAAEIIEADIEETRRQISQTFENLEKVVDALPKEDVEKMLKYISKKQYELENLEKELESVELGMGIVRPNVLENLAGRFPLYNLFADFIQPFTQYDTSTLLRPEVELDKEGQPKKELTLRNWLNALRYFGISVYPRDDERWAEIQKEQDAAAGRKVYADFAYFISKVPYEDPELFERIKEAVIYGNLPISLEGMPWLEELDKHLGNAATLPPLEIPAFRDTSEYRAYLSEAQKFDLESIDIQAREAIEALDFTDKYLNKRLTEAIRAVRDEKKSRIKQYYDYMATSEQWMKWLETARKEEELQRYLERLTEVVTAEDVVGNIKDRLSKIGQETVGSVKGIAGLISSWLSNALETKQDISMETLARKLGSYLAAPIDVVRDALMNTFADLIKMPETIVNAPAAAQKDWAEKRLKELAWTELKRSMTGKTPKLAPLAPDYEAQIANEIFDYYLGGIMDKASRIKTAVTTDVELKDALEEIQRRTDEAIAKIQEANLPFGTLLIKAVKKKASSVSSTTRRRYSSRTRLMTAAAQTTLDEATDAVKKATKERYTFLANASLMNWSEFFDPESLAETPGAQVPVVDFLLGLAGAKVDINKKVGSTQFKEFLESEQGQQYSELEKQFLSALNDSIDYWESESKDIEAAKISGPAGIKSWKDEELSGLKNQLDEANQALSRRKEEGRTELDRLLKEAYGDFAKQEKTAWDGFNKEYQSVEHKAKEIQLYILIKAIDKIPSYWRVKLGRAYNSIPDEVWEVSGWPSGELYKINKASEWAANWSWKNRDLARSISGIIERGLMVVSNYEKTKDMRWGPFYADEYEPMKEALRELGLVVQKTTIPEMKGDEWVLADTGLGYLRPVQTELKKQKEGFGSEIDKAKADIQKQYEKGLKEFLADMEAEEEKANTEYERAQKELEDYFLQLTISLEESLEQRSKQIDTEVVDSTKKFLSEWQSFSASPEPGGFKNLTNLRDLLISKPGRDIPGLTWDEERGIPIFKLAPTVNYDPQKLATQIALQEDFARTYSQPSYEFAESSIQKEISNLEKYLAQGGEELRWRGIMLVK